MWCGVCGVVWCGVCGKTDYTATLKVFRVRVLSVAIKVFRVRVLSVTKRNFLKL